MTRNRMPELLAPARDREAFLAALAAGADAIYCGISGALNARRKAAGIAPGELAELCATAHARGTRVYVTANVAIMQREMAQALTTLADMAAAGADAAIIQDWGLLAEVRQTLPELEVHVSTQANVHDARGARRCLELGATRVTLSRELSVAEIARIHREVPDIELEVFAHGSLCVSYSGICMLSSFLRQGRSPNRGLCAQPCRLPFDLVDEAGARLGDMRDERPLCMADNCAIDLVDELAEAGVASLKIEGRMKPAAYVHAVTSAWRDRLDRTGETRRTRSGTGSRHAGNARAGGGTHPSDPRLTRSFNRGFTDAYLRGRAHEVSGDSMMSYERSTNRGELVGVVMGFEPEPGFVPRDGQQLRGTVLLHLEADVGAGDSIELRHPDEPQRFLVATAPRDARAGETLRCPAPRPMSAGSEARLTRSQALVGAATEAVARLEREVATEQAPASRDDTDLAPQKGKTVSGSEVGNDCVSGHVASGELVPKRAADDSTRATREKTDPRLCVLVTDADDALRRATLGDGVSVYLDVNHLGNEPWAAPDPSLVERVLAAGITPVLDEVCHDRDHARLDPWMRAGHAVAVGSLSELALASRCGATGEVLPCIPVHNTAAALALTRGGARIVWLSPELSLDDIRDVARALGHAADAPELGIFSVGRPRLATCERCVLQVAGPCDHDCPRCERRTRELFLNNIDDRQLPVRTDARGRSRIYDDEITDLTPYLRELRQAGVTRLMVDATALSRTETTAALTRLQAALRSEDVEGNLGETDPTNSGLLLSGVL